MVADGRHALEALVAPAPALALAGDGANGDVGRHVPVRAVVLGGSVAVVAVATLRARAEALPRLVGVPRPRRRGEERGRGQEDDAGRAVAHHRALASWSRPEVS